MEQTENKPQGTTYDGGVTEEQINKWKAVHRKVYRIDVTDGADLHVGYFHRPSLQTMKAMGKVAKTDEVQASEVMFDNCFLGGSDEMRKDALLFNAAGQQLAKMFSSCQGSLKNL